MAEVLAVRAVSSVREAGPQHQANCCRNCGIGKLPVLGSKSCLNKMKLSRYLYSVSDDATIAGGSRLLCVWQYWHMICYV